MALSREDLRQIQAMFQQEVKQLKEYVDKKFDQLDTRLDGVEFTVENLIKDVNKLKKQEGL